MSQNSILIKIEHKVAYITLNRPEVFNSFNREMAFLLQDTLDACENNKEVRAIVLSGNGKAFCAGQDLKEVTDPALNPGFKKNTRGALQSYNYANSLYKKTNYRCNKRSCCWSRS